MRTARPTVRNEADAPKRDKRRVWNPSTRLTPPRQRGGARSAPTASRANPKPSLGRRAEDAITRDATPPSGDSTEQASANHRGLESTRTLIERAVDEALGQVFDPGRQSFCADVDLKDDGDASEKSLLHTLDMAAEEGTRWGEAFRDRQQQRAHEDAAAMAELAREEGWMKATAGSRVEYEQRKLALQTLRARVHREILFLQATAQELAHRESLLDDAFDAFQGLQRRRQRSRSQRATRAS
ncbi:hypothetical protein ATCC90586_008411 [Pythium insidiosum]|nr:hypothetical protein ATCC90586_008411 [Pythium insidiosum]